MPRRALLLASLCAALGCGSSVTSAGDAAVDAPAMDVPAVDVPAVDVPVLDVPVRDVPTVDRPPTARVPLRHRAVATTCSAERPASTCESGGTPSSCTADRECAMGTNGRCVGNPHDGCRCSYDVCTTDAECTMGGPCECRLASRGGAGANVCLGGDCRVDADCGPGGYCSPSFGECGDFGGVVGYYCHRPADECVDDADCVAGDAGFLGQMPYCMFSRVVGRWRCSNQGCAG